VDHLWINSLAIRSLVPTALVRAMKDDVTCAFVAILGPVGGLKRWQLSSLRPRAW